LYIRGIKDDLMKTPADPILLAEFTIYKMIKKANFTLHILRSIGEIGDRANIPVFVVGGYVRDRFLGRSGKDIDFVVLGDGPAFAQLVARQLTRSTCTVYPNFGTAMVRHRNYVLEFVGARKESYRGSSRNPEVEQADLDTDLARRDFTINAMAVSLNSQEYGRLIDPFQGLQDLQQGLIRTPLQPEKTFYDDPLRIMRAIRFACLFNFQIDDATKAGLATESARLHIISQERITDELLKIIGAKKPSLGFRLMDETSVLPLVMPEIANLRGVDQIGQFRHKDVFDHTLKVLDNVARVSDDIKLRLVALYHDVAKPQTKEFKAGIGWTFHGHEELGARMLTAVGKRLRLPHDTVEYIQKLVRLHLRPIHLAEEGVTDSAIRRLIFQAGAEMDDLITLCRADITSSNAKRVVQHLANFDYVVQRMQEVEERDRLRQFQPPVRGDEIMAVLALQPGPLVGKMKNAIEEAILNGIIPNEHDAAFAYMMQIKDEILVSSTSP
jgi:poly(A) polymerase